jgi:hypothetical protein
VVPDRKGAVRQLDLDLADAAGELGGVVEQVGHGALDAVRHPDRPGRGERGGELDPRPVQPGPVDDVLGQRVPAQLLDRGGRLLAAGQLHGVGDQAGQVVDAGEHRGDQPVAVLPVQQLYLAQHLDVGAQRGQRGAQLVRGVGDQLALAVGGVLHGAEHRVEADREPAELVPVGPLARFDPVRQVAGPGDPLGRVGQRADRPQRGPGDPPAQAARQQDAGQAGGEQLEAQVAELVLDLGRRQRHLDRVALAHRRGDKAHVDALEVDRAVRLGGCAGGDRAVPVVDRQYRALVGRWQRRAGRADDLEVVDRVAEVPAGAEDDALGVGERRAGRGELEQLRTAGDAAAGREVLHRLHLFVELCVDVAEQLGAYREVGEGDTTADADRDGERGGERYPSAQLEAPETRPGSAQGGPEHAGRRAHASHTVITA